LTAFAKSSPFGCPQADGHYLQVHFLNLCYNYFFNLSLHLEYFFPTDMNDFLVKLKDEQPDYYWLFYSAWQAKQYFEDMSSGRKYTYRVYVERDLDANPENCIHVYTEGEGIAFPPGHMENWYLGWQWQNMFVNGIRDLWAIAECGQRYGGLHDEFVSL